MVNIPVKSTRLQSKTDSIEPDEHPQYTDEPDIETYDDRVAEDTRILATPRSVAVTSTETPPNQGNEAFKTPATSRHKRFDSEETDDDTIVISATIDSTATHGYQTAEEEISNSDDDAPEIETSKAAPSLPHRKSGRSSRAKKSSQHVVRNAGSDVDTIEAELKQPENNPSAPRNVIDTPITEHDKPRIESTSVATLTGLEPSIVESQKSPIDHVPQSLGNPDHRPIPSTGTVQVVSTANTPSESLPANETTTVSVDDKVNALGLPSPPEHEASLKVNNIPSQDTMKDNEGFKLLIRDPSAHTHFLSNSIQARQADPTPASTSVRLPLKATSSLSSYRRDRLHQKAASSAGAFRMQNDWSKKRSSFVVS